LKTRCKRVPKNKVPFLGGHRKARWGERLSQNWDLGSEKNSAANMGGERNLPSVKRSSTKIQFFQQGLPKPGARGNADRTHTLDSSEEPNVAARTHFAGVGGSL